VNALRGKGRSGVVAALKLCDPYLSASETSFSQWGAIQIQLRFTFYKMAVVTFKVKRTSTPAYTSPATYRAATVVGHSSDISASIRTGFAKCGFRHSFRLPSGTDMQIEHTS